MRTAFVLLAVIAVAFYGFLIWGATRDRTSEPKPNPDEYEAPGFVGALAGLPFRSYDEIGRDCIDLLTAGSLAIPVEAAGGGEPAVRQTRFTAHQGAAILTLPCDGDRRCPQIVCVCSADTPAFAANVVERCPSDWLGRLMLVGDKLTCPAGDKDLASATLSYDATARTLTIERFTDAPALVTVNNASLEDGRCRSP